MFALKSSISRKNKLRPRLPIDVRIYTIGDIHGRVDLLDNALHRVDVHLAASPTALGIEVFLGDYIDRGPASREVLDRLVRRSHTNRTVFLKGNHDTYLTDFVTNPSLLEEWQELGGLETLMSYGVTPLMNADPAAQVRLAADFRRALPRSHDRFVRNLKSSFTCGDFFFVHAGVRPGIPLEKQREADLLWIRHDFLFCEEDFGKFIVHGHTPVSQPDIRPNRVNIDTGAYATGRLTCLVLEGDEMLLI
jgi:serine/threonine protein phosphatase 1